MRSMSFYDKLSELSTKIYHQSVLENEIDHFIDRQTGTYIKSLQWNNNIIFVIKGSDDVQDWKNNAVMKFHKNLPQQFYKACQYYEQIRNIYKNIIFTGYSLGGSIAQMLGAKYGNETVTFEAYGTKEFATLNYSNNIINFGNIYDWVFMDNFENHIGEIYIMHVDKFKNKSNSVSTHFYWNYGKPSNSEKFNGDIEHYKNNGFKHSKDFIRDGIIPYNKQLIKYMAPGDVYNKTKNLINKIKNS